MDSHLKERAKKFAALYLPTADRGQPTLPAVAAADGFVAGWKARDGQVDVLEQRLRLMEDRVRRLERGGV